MTEQSPSPSGSADDDVSDAAHETPSGTPAGSASAPAASARSRSRIAALCIAAAVLLIAGAGAGAWGATALAGSSTSATAADGTGTAPGTGASDDSSSGFAPQDGFGSRGGSGSGGASSPSGTAGVDSTEADATQIEGVVTIVSRLGYESAESAGTGIVLTSSGRILTNNHVIDGATAIEVTDESTGRTYSATVVGTNGSEDVAVLQLADADGLQTVDIADDAAALGDDVTAVGNANGTGTLSAADGTITGTGEQITTRAEGSSPGETLEGLLETSADVVSGDSGGPLKNPDGQVVGITTAATAGSTDITGYAIPITTAMSVAEQILAGQDTDEITIGRPAFIGVSLSSDGASTGGAVIAGVLEDTPAATAGLAAGDVVTAVDGDEVDSADALSAEIGGHRPGDTVTITWTGVDGVPQVATVTLIAGPAD